MGWPSALTTRPTTASPTGTSMMRPVRLTVSPSLMRGGVAEDRDADVVLLEVEHQAEEAARELDELAGHRAFEAVDARDAVADREHGAGLGDQRGASKFWICFLMIWEISSALSCIWFPGSCWLVRGGRG